MKKKSFTKTKAVPVRIEKLRPIQELIRRICRNDHTKGIFVR